MEKLQLEISFDKITASFMLDTRDDEGLKSSSFYSASVSRKGGLIPGEDSPAGFTAEEVKLVRCLLSKHVVSAVYDDAIRRRRLSNTINVREEVISILTAYDNRIAQLLMAEKK